MIRRFSFPLPARVLLPALLLLLALGCQGRSRETSASSPSFILKGTLVYEDGEPVTNAQVWVFNEGAFGFVLMGDSGSWENPNASANSEGRFEIVVNRAFLPDSGSFLLGVAFGSLISGFGPTRPIMTAEGITIHFPIDPAVDTLDLDRTMGSLKVRRAGQGN